MQIGKLIITTSIVIMGLIGFTAVGFSHGDVQPQAVDITGLKELGDGWLEENPYSAKKTPDQIKRAIEIGCAAYNQNCARCHGLGVVSGGVAPDLRYLEKDQEGDAWYINRVRKGYFQNGIGKMPAFDKLMPQEAMWSIRAYVNIRPEEDDEAALKGAGGNCQTLDYERAIKVSQ